MDAIFKQTDFNHDDKKTATECTSAFEDWLIKYRDNYGGGQGVLDGIGAFRENLTHGQCPSHESQGWKQAVSMFSLMMSAASYQVDKGKLQSDHFHEALVKMMVEFFHYGPATIHVKIIRSLLTKLQSYTKSLEGKKVKEILEVVCSPIKIKEDSEEKKIYQLFKLGVTDVIRQCFNKETQLQEKDTLEVIFNFLVHTYLDYQNLDKDSYDFVVSAGHLIHSTLRTHWKDFDDVAIIKRYIQRINEAVKYPGFPQSKGVEGNVGELFLFIRGSTQKPGHAETFCNDVFDLLESTSKCQTEEVELLFDLFSGVYEFFSKQPKDVIKKNTALFNCVIPRFKALVKIIDIQFLKHTRFALHLVGVLDAAFAKNKQLVSQWIALVVPLLGQPCPDTLRACKDILSHDDVINWKEHQNVADDIFQAFNDVEIPSQADELKEFCANLTSCISCFLKGLKKARILKSYDEGFMLLSIKYLDMNNDHLFNAAGQIANHIEINVKDKKKSVMQVMKRLFDLLKSEDMPWLSDRQLSRAVESLFEKTLHSVGDGKIFSNDDMILLVDMCIICLKYEGISPMDSNVSPYYLMAVKILSKLVSWLGTTKRLGLASQLIPLFIKTYDEDDDKLFQLTSRFLAEIGQFDPSVISPYLGQLIKLFLEKEAPSILNPINNVYPKYPQPMKAHFQEMLSHLLDDSNPTSSILLRQIFLEASKKQPELFTEKNMEALVNLSINDTTYQASSLQILQELSKRKPEKMLKTIDLIITYKGWNPLFTAVVNDILCSLALHSKSVANKVINYLLDSTRTNQEKANMVTAVNGIRLLGFKYPDIIKQKRQEIERITTHDSDIQNLKQTTLDMIDGKTSDELKNQLNKQQQILNDLVDKVDEVEVIVTGMNDEISNQGKQLQNVANDVSEQGQRLDHVEETVEETVSKVEEIDSKTLSHAPYWSRDISKLLNPQAEHDWRLLSSRLGYINDDIRGWAQQADPCMAMLNEWYATHKTSEATFAVLNNLQEMDRMDAAIIVENAMKNAEAVVEDEDFVYASPPPIFISYQWGHQEEVKLLKKHLEMAGYECWLDIGQMGGGDKLFEKIDNGLRAAKVVISCVTTKYTKSPNCNREVNLSVGLNKPIIPLLLENCSWPPPGSMGPIFSESLYIRFFQRKEEKTTDDRYWSEPKFLEVLMQLNINGVPPDENKIQPVYKDWWIPIEEKIHIDKSKTRNGGQGHVEAGSKSKSDKETESPEVFISYQWGKQKNIIKLYERLTSMGFNCWLDIKQMGGGDSLYDKIDKGIRGSKVVLSCVTHKYALSANCRREVSLADALTRPMVPLLLEQMTWPPPGPMGMVMTQLLYIGFTKEEQQIDWQGPEFDQLIQKLHQHIPPKAGTQLQTATVKKKADDQEKKSKDKPKPLGTPMESTQKADDQEKKSKDKPKPLGTPMESTQKADDQEKKVKNKPKSLGTPNESTQKADDQEKKSKNKPKSSGTPKESTQKADDQEKKSKDKPKSLWTPKESTQKADGKEEPKATPKTKKETKVPVEPAQTASKPKAVVKPITREPAQTASKPKAVVKPITSEAAPPPLPPPPPPPPQSPPAESQKKSKSCIVL